MRIVVGMCAVVVFSLCGLFVWPTMWRYDRIDHGSNSYPVRVHRITGITEMLGRRGWESLEPSRQDQAIPEGLQPLAEQELQLIQTHPALTGSDASVLLGAVYNGNDFHVYDVVVFALRLRFHENKPSTDSLTITVGNKEVPRVTFNDANGTWLEVMEVRRIAVCKHLPPLATARAFANTGWANRENEGVMAIPAAASRTKP